MFEIFQFFVPIRTCSIMAHNILIIFSIEHLNRKNIKWSFLYLTSVYRVIHLWSMNLFSKYNQRARKGAINDIGDTDRIKLKHKKEMSKTHKRYTIYYLSFVVGLMCEPPQDIFATEIYYTRLAMGVAPKHLFDSIPRKILPRLTPARFFSRLALIHNATLRVSNDVWYIKSLK